MVSSHSSTSGSESNPIIEVTEDQFLAATASSVYFAQAVARNPQGWHNLIVRKHQQLLARARQFQYLKTQIQKYESSDEQVSALAAGNGRSGASDLMNALHDTPKVQKMIGENKAQQVLGREAPRPSYDTNQRALRSRGGSSSTMSEKELERERLANELAEGRRLVEDNLRRLTGNEGSFSDPTASSHTASPRRVTFNTPQPRTRTSEDSHASEQEQPAKAMKMLGIGPNTEVQNAEPPPRSLPDEAPKYVKKHKEDPLKRLYLGRSHRIDRECVPPSSFLSSSPPGPEGLWDFSAEVERKGI